MARPFRKWNPAVNVDLKIRSADGPLVIEGNDPRWPLLLKSWIEPVLYLGADNVFYLGELTFEDGAEPLRGAKIEGFQYMPDGMSFFGSDLINGEPTPEDAADTVGGENYRYLCCGYRMALRGWIASRVDNLNLVFEARWADAEERSAGAARGAWTGLVAELFDGRTELTDYLMYALHGKRLGDAHWEYRGGKIEDPSNAFVPTSAVMSPWSDVESGRVRLLISGGSPAWTITVQYWDESIPNWVDIISTTADLQSYVGPGFEDCLLLGGALFHGATKVFPGAIVVPAPVQETWFNYFSVSCFDPWVLDMGDQTYREFLYRLTEMGFTVAPYLNAPLAKIPVVDIQHYLEGYTYGPERLRDYDDDGGWGVLFNNRTSLYMRGIEDRKQINTTTDSGKYLPLVLSDVGSLGAELPFTYVGRYKFKDMPEWTGESVLVSFGFAAITAAPSPTEGGLGLIWRPDNDGELVLKYWDGVDANWLELVVPFSIEDYNEGLVDLAFSWTGGHGGQINRNDHELRIVVDGVTVASIIEENLVVHSTWAATIGTRIDTVPNSFVGHWFGGVTYFEPCNDTDIRHAFDVEGAGGFQNPGFETADESGRPGEADGWEWQSFQGQGGWAEFSAYRPDLESWQTDRENFEAGWLCEENPGNENQYWLNELAEIVAKVFNATIPDYETTLEDFALWDGLPWLDSYTLVPPCEDTIGPGPTGFNGWYDTIYSTNEDPLGTESFDEAWDNDPLSIGLGPRWTADTAQGGRLRGTALAFPLTIPPNQNRLILLTDPAIGSLVYKPIIFSLPHNTYNDLASLVTDLNDATSAELTGRGVEFRSWSDDSGEGLWFGWDNTSIVLIWFGFATLQSDMWRDARSILGLASFSPSGSVAGIGIPAWAYSVLPGGVAETDRFLLDSWSSNLLEVCEDAIFGKYTVENNMFPALFDISIPRETIIERFMLDCWFGSSAIWVSDMSEIVLEPAMFDSGVEETEHFLDTEWPDEIFPT